MPKYNFDVIGGRTAIPDHSGIDLADDGEARNEGGVLARVLFGQAG